MLLLRLWMHTKNSDLVSYFIQKHPINQFEYFNASLTINITWGWGLKHKKFHASATARKKVNRISSLEDETGNKITNEQGLRDVARNYLVNIIQK